MALSSADDGQPTASSAVAFRLKALLGRLSQASRLPAVEHVLRLPVNHLLSARQRPAWSWGLPLRNQGRLASLAAGRPLRAAASGRPRGRHSRGPLRRL